MVFGFALSLTALILLYSGFSGKSIADTIRGTGAGGFFLSGVSFPDIAGDQAGGGSGTVSASAITPSGGGSVFEVFYDPLGEYWDSGSIHKGAIGGHSNHVHTAAPTATLIHLASVAESHFHLRVSEFAGPGVPARWGPVHHVHVPGSWHYKHEAFDASGTAANMKAYARYAMAFAQGGGSGAASPPRLVTA